MNSYRITISDRKRAKRITIEHGESLSEAIASAIGQRCYGLPTIYSWTSNGKTGCYHVSVKTGRTINGATPVKNIWAFAYAD